MQPNDPSIQEFTNQDSSQLDGSDPPDSLPMAPSPLTPVETLQKRYADQLSQDIEQLETQKSKLREDIQTLTQAYSRLQASVESLKIVERSAIRAADAAKPRITEGRITEGRVTEGRITEGNVIEKDRTDARKPDFTEAGSLSADEFVRPTPIPSPRLPGEPAEPRQAEVVTARRESRSDGRSIELPLPATSAQRRQLSLQSRQVEKVNSAAIERKGLILSAIAALLMTWHFCVVAALGQGGRWIGIPIGALGTGFMPAVALLWLRMLVVVPALVLLAPQLHEDVWEDLRDWTYSRDKLLLLLIGSGIALFISQALLYQCLGLLGATVGAALLFLYPISAVPLNAILKGDRALSALTSVALVAIAMGGVLTLKPAFQSNPTSVWLGLFSSLAFSLYIALTNLSYRQPKCHPIPAGLVQFIVVATLSSAVLLIKPIEPVAIDWLSFALWGILLGFLMLIVYLFNYSSLRLIGSRTAIIAAAAPLLTLLLTQSFTPTPALAVVQWTGIALISIGGIALGKEKAA